MTITPPKLASIPASPLAIGSIRTYGSGMFVYGVLVIVQGPDRWSGPSYATAVAIADPWQWGAVVAVLGAGTVIGSLRGWFTIRNVGLYGCAAWLGIFALSVIDVASTDPHVSYAGAVIYATFGVAMCWVARARERRSSARISPRL
jgi:hypothetical protein